MATIKLIKKTNKVWVHEPSDGLEFIFSKHYCKTVGEKFRVVEWGGSILKEYNVTDVVVKNIGGSDETFATAELLMKRLEALNYTGFYREGSVVAADLISTDPSNNISVGTDGGLFSGGGVIQPKQNKVITFSLSDLGVATFAEVTDLMVANYITSLGIVEEPNYDYFYKLNDAIYNFDVTANWALEGVTDEASFINWLATRSYNVDNDLTNIVVTDFSFASDRIACNMTADGTFYDLSVLGLVNANKIGVVSGLQDLYLDSNQIVTFNPTIALPSGLRYLGLTSNQIETFNPTIALPSGLQYLYLNDNQIVTFNPTIALPSSLMTLYLYSNQIVTFNPTIALPSSLITLELSNNQMTLEGYTASEVWATNQPAFTNPCSVYFNDNIDSITGTPLEALLISKNCIIIP